MIFHYRSHSNFELLIKKWLGKLKIVICILKMTICGVNICWITPYLELYTNSRTLLTTTSTNAPTSLLWSKQKLSQSFLESKEPLYMATPFICPDFCSPLAWVSLMFSAGGQQLFTGRQKFLTWTSLSERRSSICSSRESLLIELIGKN